MQFFLAAMAALSGLAGLIWLSRHLKIFIENRRGFVLTGEYPGPPSAPPMLSVVVAAKDEQECIERCVRTMLAQDYPNFEIIVCNDRSGDRTAEIVAGIAAEDPRVRLVNITDLPAGWKGKNNAMQTGVAQARGEWICMIDADCRQLSNRTLSVAMQYARDRGTEFLSVLPLHEMVGFWENVVQPVGTGVMMIWFDPNDVNNPRKKHAYANGAFMLLSRRAYQAVGTHAAVRECLNEDMHMAAIAKSRGLGPLVVRSRGLEVVRMYTTLRQMHRGWSRIFLGTFVTFRRLAVSFALMSFMGLLPYVAAAVGLAGAAMGAEPAWLWLTCGLTGAAAAAVQISVIFRFYGLLGGRQWLAWTYLMGSCIVLAALVSAMLKLRKSATVTWRDTSYGPADRPAGDQAQAGEPVEAGKHS